MSNKLKEPSKRLMVSLKPDIADKLTKQATKEGRTLSNMIYICIQKYLDAAK